MADETLGTARGKLVIDGSQARAEVEKTATSVDKFRKNTESAGSRAAKALGKGLTAAAVGVAGGFALAINSAAQFEKRISAISAVSGASASEVEQIRQKALQLGKDTAFSASEAASAMEELVKAGVSIPQVLNGAADAVVALAAAGEVSLPEAATIAANAMNVFKLSAEDMPRVADLIAGAANASAIDVSQFGQSLSQSGAAAALAGVKFEDLSTAIALMGNAGIKGSDAGTSLKTMLLNLNPATQKQVDLFKKLGLITKDGANQFFDASGKAKRLGDIAGILQKSLKGMTRQQKLATLEILFGSDAIRAAAILADNGAQGFENMSKSMGKVKAADVAKTRLDNLSGSVEQLKGSAETLAITIGESLQGAVRGMVDGLNQFLGLLIDLAKRIPALIESGKRLASEAFERLKQAWNSEPVQRFVGALIRLWRVISGPLLGFLKSLLGLAINLAKIAGGVLVLAFDVVSRVMSGVASTAEFVSRNWGIVSKVLIGLAVVVGPMMVILAAQLAALGVAAIISAGKQVVAWTLTQAAAIKSIAVMIVQSAIMVGRWILMGTVALAQAARIAAAWLIALGPIALIVAAVIALVALIVLKFDTIKQWISNAWNFVKSITATAWRAISSAVAAGVAAAISWIASLPGRAFRALGNLATTLYSKGRELIAGWLAGMVAKVVDIWNFFKSLPGRIAGFFAGVGTWLFEAGRQLIMGFINGIKSMAGSLAQSALDTATNAVGGVLNFLHIGSPSKLFHGIGQDTIQGMINGIMSMQGDLANTMKTVAAVTPASLGDPSRLPSAVLGRTGSATTGSASNTWSPNVTVNNAPPGQTDKQIIESLRRTEALYQPTEVLVA